MGQAQWIFGDGSEPLRSGGAGAGGIWIHQKLLSFSGIRSKQQGEVLVETGGADSPMRRILNLAQSAIRAWYAPLPPEPRRLTRPKETVCMLQR
ncbi:hypothetical protein N7510_008764 [Penicillium lagena]|uniref:uncharacterized protein n=1 Tax=Penicillium lagena TaxID=94218 RepID=UPI002540D93C|nr:uncharacterized protein N7510_008764 [Penicillium lagena]KAJ5605983.1 hypothetical protein N7510_008764 [Penicillium lagena]